MKIPRSTSSCVTMLVTRLFTTAILLATLATAERGALGAILVVSNTTDNATGSLRATLASASAGDTINFAASLSGQTILLTNGAISLSINITIDGSTLASPIQINGNHTSCAFVLNGGNSFLNSLIITNGYNDYGGGIEQNAFGGSSLTVSNCVLTGNTATTDGGGAYGTILKNCVLTGNTAGSQGGGEWGTTMFNCTLTSNTAVSLGGGSVVGTVNNCTYTGNTALFGGGGAYQGLLNNCTFTGNSAGNFGGGAYGATLNNCTLAGNTVTNYGGGSAFGTLNNCTLIGNSSLTEGGGSFSEALTNCIVYSNAAPSGPNCATPTSSYYCCTTPDTAGTGNITSAPLLAALGNYGGPTQTMPPLPGSPVVDAGSDSVTSRFGADQRGYPRLSGSHVDIGAVEVQIAGAPFQLPQPKRLGNGLIQFGLTNLVGGSFTVFASTNVAIPFNTWSNLGPAIESPAGSGRFQFTDAQAASYPRRFYRVTSP